MVNKVKGIIMKRTIFILLIGLLGISTPSLIANYYDSKMQNVARENVIKLFPVGRHDRGGTGFAVKAPSNKIYTLTNAHICRISDNGELDYTVDNIRYARLSILEVSLTADLCILTSVPNADGIKLADETSAFENVYIFGHPHLDELTFSSGKMLNKAEISLVADFNMNKEECEKINGVLNELNPLAKMFLGLDTACVVSYTANRTNAIVFPGNSGSPVLNFYSEVIGVVFASNDDTHFSYLVTLEDVQKFLSRY